MRRGLEERAKEFIEKGADVYVKTQSVLWRGRRRFPGFIWLIATGFALPKTRDYID